MSRKTPHACQNPWVAQIDSVERKLMNSSEVPTASRSPEAQLSSGWFSCRTKYWIDRLAQLSEELQTSTVTGKQCSEYEECQQLLQQSMPTLQRLNQRGSAPVEHVIQQEEAIAVAMRAASKQRAAQRKAR